MLPSSARNRGATEPEAAPRSRGRVRKTAAPAAGEGTAPEVTAPEVTNGTITEPAPRRRARSRKAPGPEAAAFSETAGPDPDAAPRGRRARKAARSASPGRAPEALPEAAPAPRSVESSAGRLLGAQSAATALPAVAAARMLAPPPARALPPPPDPGAPRRASPPLTPLASALGAGAARSAPSPAPTSGPATGPPPGAAAHPALAARAATALPAAPSPEMAPVPPPPEPPAAITVAPAPPVDPEPRRPAKRSRNRRSRSRARSTAKAAAAATVVTEATGTDGAAIHDRIRKEARSAGLGRVEMPSTEAVARRRIQLWGVATVVLSMIAVVLVIASFSKSSADDWVSTKTLRVAVLGLALSFTVYAMEKEMHLRRLSRLLADERVLNAALTNRLKVHSALTAAGKAVNSVLDLDEVLEVILSSALEMLEGSEGSVMLLESDGTLAVVAVQGTQLVKGQRLRGDASLAAKVARTREPAMVGAGPAIPGRDDPRGDDGRTQGAMCVPLVNRGELLGVLDVEAGFDRAFDEYDLHVLSLFAEPAAAAIANARLYGAERAHVAELLDLDRMKSQFVATVSHELRTPLTSIRGAIAAARRPVPEAQRSELFDVVERQTDRLATMVEEMFAAAQLERHGSAPLLRRIELASLVRLVALDSQVAGRPVRVEAPETCEVRADPEAMRRIVSNLVENAHKYGAAPIRLIVEPDGDRVMLSVVDHGPGVPPAEREKIFERFYRAEHTRDNRPGIGLGLPIVRGLVEACGGSVWVEDAPGGGAAFRVSLRTRHADEQEAPWPASPGS